MKSLKKRVPLLCLVLFAVGCSSVNVSTDFDSEIDFAELSTYAWLLIPEKPSAEIQKELTQNTLIEGRVQSRLRRYKPPREPPRKKIHESTSYFESFLNLEL